MLIKHLQRKSCVNKVVKLCTTTNGRIAGFQSVFQGCRAFFVSNQKVVPTEKCLFVMLYYYNFDIASESSEGAINIFLRKTFCDGEIEMICILMKMYRIFCWPFYNSWQNAILIDKINVLMIFCWLDHANSANKRKLFYRSKLSTIVGENNSVCCTSPHVLKSMSAPLMFHIIKWKFERCNFVMSLASVSESFVYLYLFLLSKW